MGSAASSKAKSHQACEKHLGQGVQVNSGGLCRRCVFGWLYVFEFLTRVAGVRLFVTSGVNGMESSKNGRDVGALISNRSVAVNRKLQTKRQ